MEERKFPLTLTVLRKRMRISQSELSLKVGLSQPEISLIESGFVTDPRNDALAEIAKILDVKDPKNLLIPYEDYLKIPA